MTRTPSFLLPAAAAALFLVGCPVGRMGTDAGPIGGDDVPFVLPDVPIGCEPGLVACPSGCSRVVSDNMNCGSCGNACPAGSSCALGTCSCFLPMIGCEGTCVDPQNDVNHCGTCGNACTAAEMCTDGRCIPDCDPATEELCYRDAMGTREGFCANLMTDPLNCGGCDTVCAGGATCQAGRCACPGGQINCGGTCVDPMTDPLNCGACLSSCGAGGSCSGGRCSGCAPGLTLCGATVPRCYDTMTSTLHCGSCGRSCGGGEGCAGGLCTCSAGLTDCGMGCLDLRTNVDNCGACGVDCGPGGICNAGTCMCAAGLTMCGPECADLMRNREHCGGCDSPCAMGETCRSGVCVMADSFRVVSFGTTGCRTVDHAVSGDDHGGVAVSTARLFVTGDGSTVRMSAADLTTIQTVGVVHDAMLSDVESETVYVLMNATAEISGGSGMATQLGELDPMTGTLTATRIALTMPIPLAYGTGIMSGYREALLGVPSAGNLQWWRIELPTGVVTRMGTTSNPTHRGCESWGWWGVAELIDDVRYATYVESTTRISRLAIPETGMGTVAPAMVSTFTNLGDMCSISFSTSRDRWYFHHEYESQFSPTTTLGEIAGYCDATWDRP